jgi:bla regulator protein BlaR1
MSTPISSLPVARKAEVVLLGIFAFTSGLAGFLIAQSMPEESARFEVASIHPSGTKGGRPSFESDPGGGVRATNVTLKLLIQIAYDIRAEQLSGGPGWTDSEEYTVIAKGREGRPSLSAAEQKAITLKRLQMLLAERFRLVLKQEANPASGYVLTVEKNGHKMPVANDPGTRQLRQVGRWELRAEGVDISTFARFLSVHLQGTVEDRTGLEGRYTFHLKWDPQLRDGQSVRSFDGLPEDSLIPAVREQLGLRLERHKVATDRYTIERAEKPTEN